MGWKYLVVSIAIGILSVTFIVVFILSRAQSATNTQKAEKPTNAAVAAKSTVSTANVIKDPLVYDGLTVEVESQITNWVTKRSFTVFAGGGGGLLGGEGRTLLVIRGTQFTLPQDAPKNGIGLGETVNVRMRGRVQIMDKVELGRALGLDLDGEDIKLDDNNIENWKEGSVLILDTINKL